MSLNTMRQKIGKHASVILGVVTFAMVVTTFAWNSLGNRGNFGGGASAATTGPNDVLATADGEAVTRQMYDQTLKQMTSQMGGGGAMMAGFVRQQTLDQVLQQAEVIAAAKRSGIHVGQGDIDAEREKTIQQYGLRKTLGLPATASISDIDAKLQADNSTMTVATILPDVQMADQAVIEKLQKRLADGVVVSDQDVSDSYKSWHTQHILVDNKKRSDVQAQKIANDLLAMAKAPGADFGALATKNSDDPGTKAKGGDDGWITMQTSYVPEFLNAVKALKAGEISAVVPSPSYGYFIIKCEAVKDDLPKDFAKQKAAKLQEITQQRKGQAESAFMQQVQSADHAVKVNDPGLRADYEVEQARKLPANSPEQTAKYQAAIKDYKIAISADKSGQASAMQVSLAGAYQAVNDKADELATNEAAADATDDPELWMQVGNAYKDQKNDAKALDAFAKASQQAYDNVSVHQDLVTTYKQMGRADLSAAEALQVKNLQPATPPPGAGGTPLTLGSGQPIRVGGPAGGGSPIEIKASPGGSAKPIVIQASPTKGSGSKPTQ